MIHVSLVGLKLTYVDEKLRTWKAEFRAISGRNVLGSVYVDSDGLVDLGIELYDLEALRELFELLEERVKLIKHKVALVQEISE